MVSHKEPERKRGGTARILAAIAIIAVGLFLLASVMPGAQAQAGAQPATTISNYTPAPTMNTNVTWSSFENGWSPLEYSNGTAYENLTAGFSAFYKNPISVQTQDIVASGVLQNDSVGGTIWNDAKPTAGGSPSGGAIATVGNTTIAGINEPFLTLNASEAATNSLPIFDSLPTIQSSQFPSNNIQYDYLTFGMHLSGPALTGAYASVNIYNGSATKLAVMTAFPDQAYYFSENLQYLNKITGGSGFNLTGSGKMTELQVSPYIVLPTGPSSDKFTLTIFAYALTTYPISLGQNATGAAQTVISGAAHLLTFNPSAHMQIYNSGYSVAVSQPLQNLTEQQTSINDGTYTEQATYQGIFSLPSAPDLSYSASNITVPLTLPSTQYEVANLNGASFLSSIQSQPNGTFTFGTVNPNSQNSLVLEVKYTSAQWDASSSPPSFFSLAGLEYYWWVSVLGFLSLIGLAALATHDFGGNEGNLRAPKGKLGR